MGEIQQIIFWQNIVSPHQIDFLKVLSNRFKITLIVDNLIDAYRKKDGWQVPDYSQIELYVQPNAETINRFFLNKDSIHIFSGIGAFKYVHKGFKIAIKYRAKIGVFSEPFVMRGIIGQLKFIRGIIHKILYAKKINFICATGDLGFQTYLNFGYKLEKIFHWGYFVNSKISRVYKRENSIVYVGRLNSNKNIARFSSFFIQNKGLGFDKLFIVGDGEHKEEINNLVNPNENSCQVILLGRLSSQETYDVISKSKLLILPSTDDGWGVVVNEALLSGTPVIASSSVGASVLLGEGYRGEIFQTNNFTNLKQVIDKWAVKKISLADNLRIKNWADNNISPEKAASYFVDIIEFIYSKKEESPVAPWRM